MLLLVTVRPIPWCQVADHEPDQDQVFKRS
jgi:hypothetical protein